MNVARVAASRSNCLSRHVGAVIVKDRQIVSTGYNGTPKGIKNCNEGGCPRCWSMAESGTRLDECLCVHAEENAIVQAACNGISIQGATLYTTFCPCSYCAKSIINASIKRVVYREAYALDQTAQRLFADAAVELSCLDSGCQVKETVSNRRKEQNGDR
ncbi:MAG: cytidine deaminase [Acidithiobacillales bacterium SM23_46]|nr:MAG: cytidine deaminase [Acidithiobacillales bacterium SM23_46]